MNPSRLDGGLYAPAGCPDAPTLIDGLVPEAPGASRNQPAINKSGAVAMKHKGFMDFADAVVSASAAAVRDWYDLSETRCGCGHSLLCQQAWLNDGLCLCVRCYREHKNPAQYAACTAARMAEASQ